MEGLHQIPLVCDIETDKVRWPAKQTMTIQDLDLATNKSSVFDSTHLPVINIERNSSVHDSLQELIRKIPSQDQFTIDFEYHDLTIEQVATYTIYSQVFVTLLATVNSLIVGFLCLKWLRNRRKAQNHGPKLTRRFSGLRNSLRDGRRKLRNRKSFRNIRDSLRSRKNSMKSAVHKLKQFGSSLSLDAVPHVTETGTNTELSWHPPLSNDMKTSHELYPALPRYT